MRNFSFLLVILTCFSCNKSNSPATEKTTTPVKKQRPVAAENGKFFDAINARLMYGGKDSTQHFDISNLTLQEDQFHYGIGREAFPALLSPEFISLNIADTIWADSTRFLVGSLNGETKAYSVPDLTHHEIVNDSLGGMPIMAAYCILADLGAIYERTYDDRVFYFWIEWIHLLRLHRMGWVRWIYILGQRDGKSLVAFDWQSSIRSTRRCALARNGQKILG